VPDVGEDAVGVFLEERGEDAIGLPGLRQRALVDRPRLPREVGRDVGGHLVEPDEALARLLGVVERVGVEEGPHELPADVLEAELEVGVLVDGMVPGVEGEGTDGIALAGRHLLRPDHAGGVARPRRGDCAVVGPR
jgi:hypothetical protein